MKIYYDLIQTRLAASCKARRLAKEANQPWKLQSTQEINHQLLLAQMDNLERRMSK